MGQLALGWRLYPWPQAGARLLLCRQKSRPSEEDHFQPNAFVIGGWTSHFSNQNIRQLLISLGVILAHFDLWRYIVGGVCGLSHFSCVRLFATLWTVAHQVPLSMGFARQEYRSGLPCPPPGDLPDQGIEPILAGRFFTTSTIREAPSVQWHYVLKKCTFLDFFSFIVFFIVVQLMHNFV